MRPIARVYRQPLQPLRHPPTLPLSLCVRGRRVATEITIDEEYRAKLDGVFCWKTAKLQELFKRIRETQRIRIIIPPKINSSFLESGNRRFFQQFIEFMEPANLRRIKQVQLSIGSVFTNYDT